MTSMKPEPANPDSNREVFLNMVAEKLGRQRRRPWDIVHPDFGPHPAEASQTEELVARFIRVFESQKGYAVRVKGADGVRRALSDIIKDSHVKRAVVWDDDRIDQFGVFNYLTGQGVAAHRWPGGGDGRRAEREDARAAREAWTRLAESCQIGITWADGACAETGTVLLQNHRGHGRLVSLLPRHHVAIFEARQIVPRLTGLTDELHRLAAGDALPAYTNFIAGPSGSADIAMEYIQGVHGPGTVTAIIVEEEV